eukprot:jgi/Tetstr1/465817/TSEL_010437.t1
MGIGASVAANIGAQVTERSKSLHPGRAPERPFGVQDNRILRSTTAALKERFQCACEGGAMCTREDPSAQRGRNDIPNLHCNWVTDNLLAMARPWQKYVVDPDKGLLTEFKRSRIGMVLNLQQLGEHAHCGPGLLPQSGFSYDPESFMAAGIGVFNGGWRDMATPSLEHALKIVQIMSHYISQGMAVAVHCHAGLGRTGLAIAAYLVYAGDYSAPEAVALTRSKRPGSLQTRAQENFVHTFERYVKHLRMQFHGPRRQNRRVLALGAKLHLLGGSGGSGTAGHGSNNSAGPLRGEGGNSHSGGTSFPRSVLRRSNSGNSATSQQAALPLPTKTSSRINIIQTLGKSRNSAAMVPPADLDEVLSRQRLLIGGEERRRLFHVPKFLDEVVKELDRRAKSQSSGALSRDFRVYMRGKSEEASASPGSRQQTALVTAKYRINEGQWDILDELPPALLFALLEHWLVQIGKPEPHDRTALVNALGVVRTRKPTTPAEQVADNAGKHLRAVMRAYCHSLVSCGQIISHGSAAADEDVAATVITWLVTSLMDGAPGEMGRQHSATDSSSNVSDSPSMGNETDSEMIDVIVELFTYVTLTEGALEGLRPRPKAKHKQKVRTTNPGTSQAAASGSASPRLAARKASLTRTAGRASEPDMLERLADGRLETSPSRVERAKTAPLGLIAKSANGAPVKLSLEPLEPSRLSPAAQAALAAQRQATRLTRASMNEIMPIKPKAAEGVSAQSLAGVPPLERPRLTVGAKTLDSLSPITAEALDIGDTVQPRKQARPSDPMHQLQASTEGEFSTAVSGSEAPPEAEGSAGGLTRLSDGAPETPTGEDKLDKPRGSDAHEADSKASVVFADSKKKVEQQEITGQQRDDADEKGEAEAETSGTSG